MASWKTITIPEKPTPCLVLVENLPGSATEKIVKEFFLYCGSIKEMEVAPLPDSETQVALIWFEKETAAKTACMLTNALILDKQILVSFYFKNLNPNPPEAVSPGTGLQEQKSKSSIVAELLAAGYVLTDGIIEKAKHFDQRYNVTNTLSSVVETALQEASKIDQKYNVRNKISGKANELDEKLHIREKFTQALQSDTGKKVTTMVDGVKKQVDALYNETILIADEKRKQKSQPQIASSSQTQSPNEVPAETPNKPE